MSTKKKSEPRASTIARKEKHVARERERQMRNAALADSLGLPTGMGVAPSKILRSHRRELARTASARAVAQIAAASARAAAQIAPGEQVVDSYQPEGPDGIRRGLRCREL